MTAMAFADSISECASLKRLKRYAPQLLKGAERRGLRGSNKRMSIRKGLLLVLVSSLVLSGACVQQGSSDKIKIGVYMPLTGGTATFGISSTNAIRMATEELNAAGGINGKQVELFVQDTRSEAQEAATVVSKLVTQDQVHAVIGEVGSSRSIAAAPICQSNKIPMLTPSSTNPEVTQKGDYIFRSCFTDPVQGEAIAKFAANTLNVKRAALLIDKKNDYSVGLGKFIADSFKKLGGEIVIEQAYQEGDSDFNGQLTAIKGANPDVIFLPGYYTEVGLVAQQARKQGITAPIVGGDGWDSQRLYEIGGPALVGSYFSNHYSVDDPDPAVQKFVSAYKAKYGNTPDALAATAYDAARIMFDAIKRAGSTDGAAIRDALAKTANFPGVTGVVTINSERNAVKPIVMIKVEQGGKYGVADRVTPEGAVAPPGTTASPAMTATPAAATSPAATSASPGASPAMKASPAGSPSRP
jgi:branched-chain amino acid transport system substrate-binding protein